MKRLRKPLLALGWATTASIAACSGSSDPGPTDNLAVISLQIVEPTPVATGHQVRVSAQILNDGLPATEVAVSYYLSYRPDIDSGVPAPRSHEIGSDVYADVPPGVSTHESWLDVPNDISPGGAWIFSAHLDPLNAHAERDEEDNRPANGPRAEVMVDDRSAQLADIVLETAELDIAGVSASEDPATNPAATGWDTSLIGLLGIGDVCNPHFGVTTLVTTSGTEPVQNVPITVTLELPGRIFDVLSYGLDVPADCRSIELEIWDAARNAYVGPSSPGGPFVVPEIHPGKPLAVHLGICFPQDKLDRLNQLVADYKRQVNDALRDWGFTFEDLRRWFERLAGKALRSSLSSLQIDLVVGVNRDGAIPEYEDGVRRLVGRPDDNTLTLTLNLFERVDDQIPKRAPVTFSSKYDQGWNVGNQLRIGPVFCSSATVDERGASANLEAELPITLFGKEFDIFAVEGEAVGNPRTRESRFTVDLKFLGQTLYSDPRSGTRVIAESKSFEKKIERERTFAVGPVPMTAKVEVGGAIGVDLDVTVSPGMVSASQAPFVAFGSTVSVAVNVGVAKAGVEGEFTLLDIRYPVENSANVQLINSGTQLQGTVESKTTVEVTGPRGEITLFAEVGVFVPYLPDLSLTRHTKTIFEFHTYEFEDVLSARRSTTTIDL